MWKRTLAILIATMIASSGMAFAQDTNEDQSLLERLLNRIDTLIEKMDRLIELLERQESQPTTQPQTEQIYQEQLESLKEQYEQGEITLEEYTEEVRELADFGHITNEMANDIIDQVSTSEEVTLTEEQESAISEYLSGQGITEYTIKEAELEHEDGTEVLEVKILANGQKIELYLNSETNEVIMYETESTHVVGTPGKIEIEMKNRKLADIIAALEANNIDVPDSLIKLLEDNPTAFLKEFEYKEKNGKIEMEYKLATGKEVEYESSGEGGKIEIEMKDTTVGDVIAAFEAKNIDVPDSLGILDPETKIKEFEYQEKNGKIEMEYKLESGEEYESKITSKTVTEKEDDDDEDDEHDDHDDDDDEDDDHDDDDDEDDEGDED